MMNKKTSCQILIYSVLLAVLETSADNFATLSKIEVTTDRARQIIKEIYGVELPSTLKSDYARDLIETIPASNLEKSYEFYKQILKK